MQDSPDLPQHIAAILRCPQAKRSKEQWKCLALFLLDEIQQWAALTERTRDHLARPIAHLPIESFEAAARPKRRPGAPSNLDKARAKAVKRGDAELNEYMRLLNPENTPEKRRVGRPKSLTPKYYRELLAVIEEQKARMKRSGGRVTDIAAITYLVHKWAEKQDKRTNSTDKAKAIDYYQKKLSIARGKFQKFKINSP